MRFLRVNVIMLKRESWPPSIGACTVDVLILQQQLAYSDFFFRGLKINCWQNMLTTHDLLMKTSLSFNDFRVVGGEWLKPPTPLHWSRVCWKIAVVVVGAIGAIVVRATMIAFEIKTAKLSSTRNNNNIIIWSSRSWHDPRGVAYVIIHLPVYYTTQVPVDIGRGPRRLSHRTSI